MISIVIPSYNEEKTIQKCINSLLEQSYAEAYEIILVDSSRDRTAQIVTENYPDIELISLRDKTDPGTARNIGVQKATGELIAFIDADCIAAADWLEKIADAHRKPYIAVGGAVMNGNSEDDFVGWAGYLAEFREFMPGQPKREVGHVPTCNIAYKKEAFQDFGLFQGEFYPQEDLVYNYTLVQNGKKILFDPAIRVWHRHRSLLSDFLRHQRTIGEITSRVLKVIDLDGAFLARHPAVGFCAVPFLPVIKFLKTIAVFYRFQPGIFIRFPMVLPVFALGLLCWMCGFARGIYKK